jgi:hypothetical protein
MAYFNAVLVAVLMVGAGLFMPAHALPFVFIFGCALIMGAAY